MEPHSNRDVSNPGRMAALLGFEDRPAEQSESHVPLEGSEVQSESTRQPLWKNPLLKVAVVGSGTLVAILAAGSLLSGGLPTQNKSQASTPAPVRAATLADMAKTSGDADKGKLLTELALSRQQQELEALNSKRGNPIPNRAAPLPPGPSQSLSSPPPLPAMRALPPPAPLPVIQTPPPPMPVLPATARASVSTVQDPTEQWIALGRVGSYGQVAQAGASNAPVAQAGASNAPVVGNSTPRPVAQAVQAVPTPDYKEEIPVLSGRVSRSVTVGTGTQGLLLTPVAWEGSKPELDEDRYLVQLLAPLKAADSSEALPAGAQIIARLEQASATGVLKMSAISIVTDGRETPLPRKAIMIRATSGLPLMAKNIRDRGPEIGSMDAGLFALAGAAKAAELLNRPQTQTAFSAGGGRGSSFSSTSTSPPPNILAGVIEGGANLLTQQITARNQAAIQEALGRPNMWVLEAGIKVEVFVNQSVPL